MDITPTTPPSVSETSSNDVANLMAEYLDNSFGYAPIESGSVRKGIIVRITPTEILVDIGAKSEGVISDREFERLGQDAVAKLQVGDEVMVYVIRPEDEEGRVVLSFSRAQQERDWQRAEELLKSQEVFEGVVSGYNRGGVTVKIGRLRGFVPTSQLASLPPAPKDTSAENDARLIALVGTKLKLKVLELDQKRNRLILSERHATRESRKQAKERLLTELQRGDVVSGTVTSISDFGAFIDLGGADGLVHLSELSWGHIDHPRDVLQIGQTIQSVVLNVDAEKRRIGLSIRRLQPEPWSVIYERYAVGQVVEATITKVTDFGAFARLDDGIEGLIHVSELSDQRVAHARNVVEEGNRLKLRVIKIDAQRKRIGLSLKQASDEAYTEVDWREQLASAEEAGDSGEKEVSNEQPENNEE